MDAKSTMIKSGMAFVENDCTITHEGKEFSSGGSWLMKRKDTGKYEGILYADTQSNMVTSWDGSIKIPAHFGKVFRSNFYNNRRQFCWFKYQGHNFIGINYSIDWQTCINVKEIK